jgi:hypothetical protein
VPGATALQVFISYARDDARFAAQLAQRLDELGYRTWRDQSEIAAGQAWENEISQALRASSVVLVVLSPSGVDSPNVRKEYLWALENGLTVLPLFLEPYSKRGVSHQLADLQHIDFHGQDGFDVLAAALADLRAGPAGSRRAPGTAAPLPLRSTRATNDRRRMLGRVGDDWIESVLRNNIAEAGGTMDLRITIRPELVTGGRCNEVQSEHPPPTIRSSFQEGDRRLLILGAPGSGKSTLLLQLVDELLGRARRDVAEPIPVVLMLSTWAAKRGPIGAWLVDQLDRRYGVPRATATRWLENALLVPCLDGLDELTGEVLADCIEELNTFLAENDAVGMVVCSRIKEYEKSAPRLALNMAAEVLAVSEEQAATFLATLGAQHEGLRTAFAADGTLRELASSVLMLSMMVTAYRGTPARAIDVLPSGKKRRKDLIARYLASVFQQLDGRLDYSRKRFEEWLGWLARRLRAERSSLFQLEDLQPSWLPTEELRRSYQKGVRGGSVWVIQIILWVLVVSYHDRLGSWFPLAMLGTFVVATLTAIQVYGDGSIKPVERLGWSWLGMILGLLLGFVLPAALGTSAYGNSGIHWTTSLAIGLPCVVAGGVSGRRRRVALRSRPNEGILRSALHTAVLGLGVGLLGHIDLFQPMFSEKRAVAVVIGLSYGLAWAVSHYGGAAVIKHFVLRSVLTRNGCTPWRYVRFLGESTRLNIMRQVGGAYMFRHQVLLEYFAARPGPFHAPDDLGSSSG